MLTISHLKLCGTRLGVDDKVCSDLFLLYVLVPLVPVTRLALHVRGQVVLRGRRDVDTPGGYMKT